MVTDSFIKMSTFCKIRAICRNLTLKRRYLSIETFLAVKQSPLPRNSPSGPSWGNPEDSNSMGSMVEKKPKKKQRLGTVMNVYP